jgi:hypothetical protein
MGMITILQFVGQTVLIALLAIMWQPILVVAGYDSALYDNASVQELAIRDALWQFGIIISVIAMTANIFWFYNELRKQSAVV